MQNVTVDWLKSIETLKDVPADQLQWMIDNSRHYTMAAGEQLFNVGETAVGTHIVVEGKIKIYTLQNQEIREMGIVTPRNISGILPFSRGWKVSVNAKVLEDAVLMTLPKEKFREMIGKYYELTEALVHIMTTRVPGLLPVLAAAKNEKMMALGRLSAGLAHELSNPAAAIVKRLYHQQSICGNLEPVTFKEIMAIRMEEGEVDRVSKKLFEILGRTEKPKLTLMERTEHEDEIRDCLEEHGVEHADEFAEEFPGEYGFTCE